MGPGEYEAPEEKKKGVTIGERLREKAPEDMPAPGQYESRSKIVEGPQFSMGEKREDRVERTVGPGHYEVPEEKKKGVTIGERRQDKAPEDLPAPGAYEQKSKIVEGPQYSIYEKRPDKIEPTVGPGEYEAPQERSKGVTIGERLREKGPEDMPAPGQYEQRSKIQEGPQYSIYEKREHKIEQTVGPGEYEAPQERAKGVTIGERRAEKAPEEVPAPGQYEQRSKLGADGPKYSVGEKRPERIE